MPGDDNMWEEACTDMLRDLWGKGWSATQIAAHMSREFRTSYTRNAIVGKVHRLRKKGIAGFEERKRGRPAGPQPRKTPVPRTVKLARLAPPPQPVIAPEPEPVAAPPLEAVIPSESLTLFELTPRTCRWPLGGPKDPATHFCGAPKDLNTPYCPTHEARAWQPNSSVSARRRAREAAGT